MINRWSNFLLINILSNDRISTTIIPYKRRAGNRRGQWRQQSGHWTGRAGSQAAGRQAPPGNGWKREHESTFLDSDWPRFRNTVHALCLSPSLSILTLLPPPQRSSQTNRAKLTSKSLSKVTRSLIEALTSVLLEEGGEPMKAAVLEAGYH